MNYFDIFAGLLLLRFCECAANFFESLRVMTFNVHLLKQRTQKNLEEPIEDLELNPNIRTQVVLEIQLDDPDVILFQEIPNTAFRELTLKRAHNHRHSPIYVNPAGFKESLIKLGYLYWNCINAGIHSENCICSKRRLERAVMVHPETRLEFRSDGNSIAENKSFAASQISWRSKNGTNFSIRLISTNIGTANFAQLMQHLDMLNNSGYPVIVGGSFNTNLQLKPYLMPGFDNAWSCQASLKTKFQPATYATSAASLANSSMVHDFLMIKSIRKPVKKVIVSPSWISDHVAVIADFEF